jgi:hypothetical protein
MSDKIKTLIDDITPGKWYKEKINGKIVVVTGFYEDETPVVCAGTKNWPLTDEDADFICLAHNHFNELLETLIAVKPHICGLLCPSTWKTGEPQPHSVICLKINKLIENIEKELINGC